MPHVRKTGSNTLSIELLALYHNPKKFVKFDGRAELCLAERTNEFIENLSKKENTWLSG